MIYYGAILIAVAMFGGVFALQDVYRRMRGSGLKISMESACIGAFAGLIVLLAMNGFSLEFTEFTLLMAFFAALDGLAFTFCSFKALDYINLSLFSLFAMLGGMLLPFLQGIIFYDEGITLAKIVCVVLVCVALAFTVEKSEKKRGTVFYIGIFVLNGLSGVITKLFTSIDRPKTSELGYSVWIAIITLALSGVVWLVLSARDKRRAHVSGERAEAVTGKVLAGSYALGALCGIFTRVSNLLLVFALAFVDTSVQYPMVTGGIMIVSTLISCFGARKPSKREIVSVAFAFAAMLALFLIPV